jgi:hypothetical protein
VTDLDGDGDLDVLLSGLRHEVDVACGPGGQRNLLAWQDKYVGGE